MNLPDLPKKNKQKEASFGLDFRAYIDTHSPDASYSYELKDTRGKDYFSFRELDDKQIDHALRSKTEKGNLIRIMSGTPGAPDYVHLKNCKHAFIVIKYPRFSAYIDVDAFLLERDSSDRKSLTDERARAIAVYCG